MKTRKIFAVLLLLLVAFSANVMMAQQMPAIPVDEDFEVDGYKIEYPGDPSAEPEMVYNCRCTMICRIKGFEKDFTDRHNDALGDMTYDEWKHQLEKRR